MSAAGESLGVQLVVTPTPDPRESAVGYTLRLTQRNGYATPTVFLPRNTMQGELRKWGPSAKRLMRLAFLDANSAARMELSRLPRARVLLGHTLLPKQLRLEHHAICPECVAQDGIFDASWHLAVVTFCPIHRTALTTECHACHRSLKLERPGVGICRCRAVVKSHPDAVKCTEAGAALLQCLRAKLIAASDVAPSPEGFAVLEGVGLRASLSLVAQLCRYAEKQSDEPDAKGATARLDRVARALQARVHGERAFLEALEYEGSGLLLHASTDSPSSPMTWKFAVPRCPGLAQIRRALAPVGPLNPLQHAVTQVAATATGPSHIPVRQVHPGEGLSQRPEEPAAWESEWIRIDAAARLIGCNKSQLIAAVQAKFIGENFRGRHGVTLRKREVLHLKCSEHTGMDLVAAAWSLDLSPWCLARLRKLKEFALEYLPAAGGVHSVEDVAKVGRFLQEAQGYVICQRPYMTLEVFRAYAEPRQKMMTATFLAAMNNRSAWTPVNTFT